MSSLIDFILRVLRKLEWAGPLLVRIIVGLAFASNGWGKLHSLDKITDFFTELHIPMAHANAVVVSTIEFAGGIMLVLGLGTRIAALLLIGVMAVATLTAKLPNLDSTGLDAVFELANTIELTYLAMFVWLLVAGPGSVSIDRLVRRPADS